VNWLRDGFLAFRLSPVLVIFLSAHGKPQSIQVANQDLFTPVPIEEGLAHVT
jgi:hypothetical protein